MDKTFLETLFDKISEQIHKDLPSDISTKQSSTYKKSTETFKLPPIEPPYLTSLLANMDLNLNTAPKNLHRTPYFNSAKNTTVNNNKPKHKLDTDQWIIWKLWKKHGSELNESFSKKELKQAYYQLAMKHHPDRDSGNSDEFIQIKKEYERLLMVFTYNH